MLTVLLQRFTLRHWIQGWKETLLLLLILALGVGVFLSVRMANRAAVVSFQAFTETLTGEGDWLVRSPAGRLTEADLLAMREALEHRPVVLHPILEVTATWPRQADDPLVGRNVFQLVGIDLINIQNLPGIQRRQNRILFQTGDTDPAFAVQGDVFETLGRKDALFITRAFAQAAGLKSGDTLDLLVGDRIHTLTVWGVLPDDPAYPTPPDNLMVMDLPALQQLAGRPQALDRVEVWLEPGGDLRQRRAAVRETLLAAGNGTWVVETPATRRQTGETMTRAFRMNLTVLSLVALVVGLYLILQALEAAVVRRREETAVLRSLGIEPATIRLAWLLESGLLGLVGGGLGIVLGWAGAQASVQAVSRTVNALYQASSVEAAHLRPGDILTGLLLGTLASLAAGWVPAREAAATPPAQILRRGHVDAGLRLLNRPGAGLLLILAGIVLARLPALPLAAGNRFPLAGYLAALAWIVGGSMLIPVLMPVLARLAEPVSRRLVEARVAFSRLRDASGRHKLAAAGLFIALGMASGMAILIQSFETTMQAWIRQVLVADIYLTSDANQSASGTSKVRGETAAAISTFDGIADSEAYRSFRIEIDGVSTFLAGVDFEKVLSSGRLVWAAPPGEPVPGRVSGEPIQVLVSESFTARFDAGRGDGLSLPTPQGPVTAEIAAVFADYGNERGSVLAPGAWVAERWDTDAVSSLALTVADGRDPARVADALRQAYPGLSIQTNRALRTEVLRIFRQTFAITYALEAIGIVVAVLGLALALISLILETRTDLTTLRSLGMNRFGIARVLAWEGTGIALAGTIGGLLLSVALGWLLVYVINKQAFGWTLAWDIPVLILASMALVLIGTGALVGRIVGGWAGRLPAERERE
ncbi:MAG: FtsX-like permease family protein [Opitutales bacterium]